MMMKSQDEEKDHPSGRLISLIFIHPFNRQHVSL